MILLLAAALASGGGYAGAAACAQCHSDIAAVQRKSNMARTWQGVGETALPAGYQQSRAEGRYSYHVRRGAAGVEFTVNGVGGAVESVVGGDRHGLSFLLRVKELGGVSLARPTLVETRYLHSSKVKGLALSPGFPEEVPQTFETAIGRVLSPSFEKKCLACHGSPAHTPAGRAGVECESCHGPAQAHIASVAKGKPAVGVVNPRKLSNAESIEVCAQCHSGFGELVDPPPSDVLISNQTTALRATECYIQSGEGLSCTTCHDPHANSKAETASVKACLGCHAQSAKKAATCPVNAKEDCVRCHMPAVERGPFTLTDHWIRVLAGTGERRVERIRSSVPPRRLFLRILSTTDRTAAEQAREEVMKGGDFFDLARKNSNDASAGTGGFLGEMRVDQMDAAVAAAVSRLDYGEVTPVLQRGANFLLFQRMPRDFRWQAIAMEEEGNKLKAKGDLDGAIDRYQRALRINPLFARALVFLGAASGEKGDRARAVAVLEQAAYLFPKDPSAHYNLGIAYGAAGRMNDEVASYRRALALEPDLTPAWLNLGAAMLSMGAAGQAAAAFEKGLEANPLAIDLYRNLQVACEATGDAEKARWAARVVAAIGGAKP